MHASSRKARKAARPRLRLTRRGFLLGCLGGAGCGALGLGYARYVEPFWPKLERLPMDLRRLAPSWAGVRILHLSDLHLSHSLPSEYLPKQLDRCAALQPDLVVLTGDFITSGRFDLLADLHRLLTRLRARHGVFAVLGNHDFGVYSPQRRLASSRAAARIADRISAELTAAGVDVLRNDCRVLTIGDGQLQLVGLDDYWSGYCDPSAAFAKVDPDLPCVVLSHNPDSVIELKDYRCDWVLCGHTHGGQVRIPLLGAPILPIQHRQYDAGRFEVGDKRLYVNRGLGYLRQVRFNCRPEITEFTLEPRA